MNNITAEEFRNRLNQFGKWRFMLYPALWLFALAMVLTELFHAIFRPIKYIEGKFRYKELHVENIEMKTYIMQHFTDKEYEYYFGEKRDKTEYPKFRVWIGHTEDDKYRLILKTKNHKFPINFKLKNIEQAEAMKKLIIEELS